MPGLADGSVKLVKVGMKLAVLGVNARNIHGRWHIARPGSYNVPSFREGENKVFAKALCGIWMITNGEAYDFVPGERDRCPACWERL